jgi:beta-lactamase regulating signal transducer with metallopeptidase domain/predicted transcriptional regulator
LARKKSPLLTDAELRLMEVLWEAGSATVSSVLEALPRDVPLAYSTVLTTLRILEQKGYVKHRKEGRAFVYRAVVDRERERERAVTRLLQRFFGGSPEQLVIEPGGAAESQSGRTEPFAQADCGGVGMTGIWAALVNGAILSITVTAAVWSVCFCIPRRMLNAAARHATWWVTLVVVTALPVLFLPIPHHGATASGTAANASRVERAVAPAPVDSFAHARIVPERTGRPAAVREQRKSAPTREAAAPQPAAPTPHLPKADSFRFEFPVRIPANRWMVWSCAAWVCASLILLIRLFVSYGLLGQLRMRAHEGPEYLQERVAEWLPRCGSRRRVRLAISDEIAVPVAAGPVRPAILIPAHLLTELNEDQLEQVCLHEAAHLARRDDLALFAERLLQAVFVLQPAIRWICRQIDLEREIACDDLVLAATGRARAYATCLMRVAELGGAIPCSRAAAAAVHDHSHLARRVEMLLDRKRHRGTGLLKARLGAVVAALGLAVWLASQSPALVAFTPVGHGVPAARPWARRVAAASLPLFATAEETAQVLEGRVMEDSSGNALASAELRVHKAGLYELAADLETDRQGRFRAEGLPPAEYTVEVSKPNYIGTTVKLRLPSPAISVRLVRYGVIDGQATDSEGRPLRGRILAQGGRTTGSARVTMLVRAVDGGGLQIFREKGLEEDGTYRFFDLPPGEYAVGLWYGGLEAGAGVQLYPDNANPRFYMVQGGEEYTNVDFHVVPHPGYDVRGRIGLPDAKATFQLALGLPEQPLLPIAQTLTEPDGSFRFAKVPPGTYNLYAAGPTGGYGAYDSILKNGPQWFGRTQVQVDGQDVS